MWLLVISTSHIALLQLIGLLMLQRLTVSPEREQRNIQCDSPVTESGGRATDPKSGPDTGSVYVGDLLVNAVTKLGSPISPVVSSNTFYITITSAT